MAFSAIGAPLAGQSKDSTGEYFVAWWIAIGAFVIGATLLLLTPRPKPKLPEAAAPQPVGYL